MPAPSAPAPMPMPYDAQAQPSYRPVPAPVPVPALTPGSGRRSSHTGMMRRSVTTPLPPISTDMSLGDLPAVPPLPSSTISSPSRTPAYPGQRVYSPVIKENHQQKQQQQQQNIYRALSPQRPPSIPQKIPEGFQSPVHSLNASLAGSGTGSGSNGNNTPTTHTPISASSLSHLDNATMPLPANEEVVPNGHIADDEPPQRENVPADIDALVDSVQAYYLGDQHVSESNGPDSNIVAFPPRESSKEQSTPQHSSATASPAIEIPPISTATPVSQPTTTSQTTSPAPAAHSQFTPDQKRPESAPHSASITTSSTTNPTPPSTGYVAYKPYKPPELSVGPTSSSTPSPTRSSLPITPFSGTPTSMTPGPYGNGSQTRAYHPSPPPPLMPLSQTQSLPQSLPQTQGHAPISISPAAPMIAKRGQPSPVTQQFVEAEVRNVRSGSPRGAVFPGPGPGPIAPGHGHGHGHNHGHHDRVHEHGHHGHGHGHGHGHEHRHRREHGHQHGQAHGGNAAMGGPHAQPPPMRHMPTAPAGGLREQNSIPGAYPSSPTHPPMPHSASAAAGRHMPIPGPGSVPGPGAHGFPPPGHPHAKRVATGGMPPPPHPGPYSGRSVTMSSMPPGPMHEKQSMGAGYHRGSGHGVADPALGGQPDKTRAYVPEAKPVPFRPGLQPGPVPIRQHGGPAPPVVQGNPVPSGSGGQPGAMRSGTMTSMTSAAAPSSAPPSSALAGQAPPSASPAPVMTSGTAAGDSSLTVDELRRWANMAKAAPNDDKIQFEYAKKLLQASKVLVARNPGDAKAKMKQRQAYTGEGIKVLKKCAHRNYPEAMYFLGDCYTQGFYGLPKDPKEAFVLYHSAAKAGHGAAAYRTAVCCELGPDAGTRRDPMKAVQWYRRAASLGDPPAMYKFGYIQLKGLLGQPRNPKEAITWLKRAAERADEDNPHALHELAVLYADPSLANNIIIKDEAYSIELLTKAGELGYKYSQYKLGQIYEFGQQGQAPNARLSIYWYTRGAAQGEHQCELSLSGWYLTGAEGILQPSDTEAYLWARKAAVAGLAKAEYAMGYFTELGIGVPSNLEEAKKWYWKASSQNFIKARERLEDLKRGGAMMEKSKLSRERQQNTDTDCVLM